MFTKKYFIRFLFMFLLIGYVAPINAQNDPADARELKRKLDKERQEKQREIKREEALYQKTLREKKKAEQVRIKQLKAEEKEAQASNHK